MCFDINPKSKKERTLWQATEDIVCYKILKKEVDGNLYGCIYSNYRYIPNKVSKSKLLIPENGNYLITEDFMKQCENWEINEGFHSFKSLDESEKWSLFPFSSYFFCKFIIPKGAYFYENKIQYVSNKIKLVEIIK